MGKKYGVLLGILLSITILTCSPESNADDSGVNAFRLHCKPPTAQERVLYTSDFRWGYLLDELLKVSKQMYVSPKRLFKRAYMDEVTKTYVMSVSTSEGEKKIKLPNLFLDSVRKHIEVSLSRHYADAVVFPDMGHSHFFIPPKTMEKLNKVDYAKDKNIFYEKLFASPDVKILYHTAEQLKMREGENGIKGPISNDQYLHWRYDTRNVVAQNDGSDNVAPVFAFDNDAFNTLRDLDGYDYFGAGFNLSANEKGCFEFVNNKQTYHYDISMEDLPSDPNGGSLKEETY